MTGAGPGPGQGFWARHRSILIKALAKVAEWVIPSFVMALIVGFILQRDSYYEAIRLESLRVMGLAAYAAAPIYEPDISLSAEKLLDIREEMDSLHFVLQGRLDSPYWVCLGHLMSMVKMAPVDTIEDPSVWGAQFRARREELGEAIEAWRRHNSFYFLWPFFEEYECSFGDQ